MLSTAQEKKSLYSQYLIINSVYSSSQKKVKKLNGKKMKLLLLANCIKNVWQKEQQKANCTEEKKL